MKKVILYLAICLIAVMGLSGCTLSTMIGSPGGIKGSGKQITETRQVSGFSGVELAAVGKLIITKGSTESLTITGDDNIVPLIKTEVREGNLVISFENPGVTINSLSQITYNLTVLNLSSLVVSGAGDISATNLNGQSLSVVVSGAGTIEANGEVGTQQITVSGAGNYSAADLKSQSVKVSISGAGNATVWAQEKLDVMISGLGRVSYYGNPVLTKNISGAGSVEAKGNK